MKKMLPCLVAVSAIGLVSAAPAENFVQVTKSNSGQTVQLASTQVLEVRLPRNPSTGYMWVETDASSKQMNRSVSKIGDDEWVSDATVKKNGKTMVGQSGTQIIRYAGAANGTTVLSFELKRPWETNISPLDVFTITVSADEKYTGTYSPAKKNTSTSVNEHHTSTPLGAPATVDWRPQCTAIRNQGSCGDCWAYATVGAFEGNIKIIDAVSKDLSEEFVTDCFQNANGCGGGWCAFDCWMPNYTQANPQGGGAVYESDDPTTCNQTGNTGTCGSSGYPHHETIMSHALVPNANSNGIPPDADMKNAIYLYGPIWVAFDASSGQFGHYSGGVITESGTNVDHAVVLVGYKEIG